MRPSSSNIPYTTQPPLGAIINNNHPLAKGLVGCWSFIEGGGFTVYDRLGNRGIGGAVTSSASNVFKTKQFGRVSSFNGTGDFATIVSNSYYELSEHISFYIRFKPILTTSIFGQILMKNLTNTSYYGLIFHNTNKIITQFTNSTTHSTVLTLNTWYDVVAVRQFNGGAGNVKVYINGIQDATTGTAASTINTTSTPNLSFGKDLVNAGRNAGVEISDLRLYNRVITQGEARQLLANPYSIYKR
jgi:hypothetical protein